ncbi:MAG: hypothetical protein ABTR07_00390 [Candidatus Competibacter denitrificans]
MSVTPDDFLAEAKALSSRTDEMGIRLTINRAYYGAFHLAKSAVHFMPGYRPSNRDEPSHQELLNWLAVGKGVVFPGCQQAKQIHEALTQGKKLRSKADYMLSDTLQPQQAATVVFNAQKVQQLIPELIKRRQSN